MVICAVPGCYSGYEKTLKRAGQEEEETKHQLLPFPTEARYRNIWVARINRENNPDGSFWTPNKDHKVCAKHFLRSDFAAFPGEKSKNGSIRTKLRLKDNALPSLHLRDSKATHEPQEPPKKVLASGAEVARRHNYVQPEVPQIEQPEPAGDEPVDVDQPEVFVDQQEHAGMELEVVQDSTMTLQLYKKQLLDKDKKYELLEQKYNFLQQQMDSVARVFNPDQIHRLQNPTSRSPWSDSTLQKSMQLYYSCGAKGYQFMRSKNFPLPEKSTIVRHCNTIESDFGTQFDMLKLMKMKVETIATRDRVCAMIFDEMSIGSKREYDPSTGQIIGHPTLPAGPKLVESRLKKGIDNSKVLASKVQNVLLVGLVKFWKQIIGYHLCDESFCPKTMALWIREMLKECDSIGLEVMIIVHDMGSCNLAV